MHSTKRMRTKNKNDTTFFLSWQTQKKNAKRDGTAIFFHFFFSRLTIIIFFFFCSSFIVRRCYSSLIDAPERKWARDRENKGENERKRTRTQKKKWNNVELKQSESKNTLGRVHTFNRSWETRSVEDGESSRDCGNRFSSKVDHFVFVFSMALWRRSSEHLTATCG